MLNLNCPDCKRLLKDVPENGDVKCPKCLQIVEIKNGKAIRAVPKELK